MDSITQAALGAASGQAGVRHRLGRRAIAFGAICGVLPDLDIVAGIGDEWASLLHHRGPSHSLLVLPVVAPLVGWLGWRVLGRRGDWRAWWHLAFWALITHPLLDTFTAYGTQLLSPFSRQRFALDGLSIVDPLYSLPLLFCVMLSLRAAAGLRTRQLTIAALALTTAYGLLGFTTSQRVLAKADAQLARDGFEPVKVRAMPTLFNNVAFRVAARDAAGDMRVGFTTASPDVPLRFTPVPAAAGDLVERVLRDERGQIFKWFADDYLKAEVQRSADGVVVVLSDMRYGRIHDPARSFWTAQARFDADGRLLDVYRERRRPDVDMPSMLEAQWALVFRGELPSPQDGSPSQRLHDEPDERGGVRTSGAEPVDAGEGTAGEQEREDAGDR
jgi:inner membrane protein